MSASLEDVLSVPVSSKRIKPSPIPAFQYSPLNNAATNRLDGTEFVEDGRTAVQFIRLLTLEPGNLDDDIKIKLETVELNTENLVEYEVLSYAWGSTEQPEVIYIGPNKQYHLQVTRNLAIALRHLRQRTKPRKIWIDAICIDQSNLDERGQQVSIMGDIYRLANRSIMWLGPSSNDSDYVMGLLRDLGSRVEIEPWTFVKKVVERRSENSTLYPEPPEYTERESLAFLNLLERVWFDRLWVRQEIFLTHTKATVQVGLATAAWHEFTRAILYIWQEGPILIENSHLQFINRVTSLHRLLLNDKAQLSSLRQVFGRCHCKDPRDRLYAIMNMLDEEERACIGSPDYSVPLLDLWKQTTLACIKYWLDVNLYADILSECIHDEPFDTPSWIPNWEIDRTDISCQMYFSGVSGALFRPKIEHLEGDILRILGVRVQFIQDVCSNQDSEHWTSTIKKFLNKVDLSQRYLYGGSILEACATAFIGGHEELSTFPVQYDKPELEEIMEAIEFIKTSEENAIKKWADENAGYFSHCLLLDCVRGRSLIMTSDGHIGLAPIYVKTGDLIVSFAGFFNPMILRSSTRAVSCYNLIGPCFLQGVMWGEAFLGPLASQHRFVLREIQESDDQIFQLRNMATEEFIDQDPRLESWPIDHEEYNKACKNLKRRYAVDVDFDTFRSMGVEVEYFDIA